MKLALLLLLVACSKDKPAVTVGSCQASPAICEEYDSTDPKFLARQRDGCTKPAVWRDAACPKGNVIGSCREKHQWTRTRHFYRGIEGQPNPAAETAKNECGAYGTWVEPSP